MKIDKTLSIAECFYSIQGEGATAGKLAYFIRLAGCNLMCGGKGTEKDGKLHNGATWRCDSIEVWLKGTSMSFDDLIHKLGGPEFIMRIKSGVRIIFTGGEPLLHETKIADFLFHIYSLYDCRPIVEVETNGTIAPGQFLSKHVQHWNVSPKLSNSGEPAERRINGAALQALSLLSNPCFKFVVANEADIEELQDTIEPFLFKRFHSYLMPAADTREELERISEMIAEYCKIYGYNFSHRMHLSIWDKKTGV